MRFLTCFTTFSLIGLLSAVSLPVTVTPNIYQDKFLIYTAEHDIVQITTPINLINYSEEDSLKDEPHVTLFIVEAETQPDGTVKDKGLYVLKEGKATKLLANGRCATGAENGTNLAFFGASDGLYVYNEESNSVDKYGSITDSIIGVEKEKLGDNIYILTESNEVFKVSDNGNRKEKLDDVPKAKQIVLDHIDNLYFVAENNKPYVRNADGVKLIAGLPENLFNVKLVRLPPVKNNAAGFLADNAVYVLYSNGSSELVIITVNTKAKITAYATDIAQIQYYAYNKKIYEFDHIKILKEHNLEIAKSFPNGDGNESLLQGALL